MAIRSVESYSELECLVLGLIAQGATSGYAMRKAMRLMHGNRWSLESGSIYRALRRMKRDVLIEESGRAGIPRRQRIEYRLTPSGGLVLSSWIGRAPPFAELSQVSDALRTRSYFIELLDPSAQVQTVRSWIAENKALLEVLRKDGCQSDEHMTFADHAKRSLVLQVEARQDWLRKLHDCLRRGEVRATSGDTTAG